MKKLKILLIFVACVLCSSSLLAQADKQHYFILFDVSGSMNRDVHRNARVAVDSLLSTFRRATDLTVIFFGNETDIGNIMSTRRDLLDDTYTSRFTNFNQERLKFRRAADLIQSRQGSVRFSDILSGLKRVKKSLADRPFESGAVIIASDGIINKTDQPFQDYKAYIDSTEYYINDLSRTLPVFLIQTASPNYESSVPYTRDFFRLAELKENPTHSDNPYRPYDGVLYIPNQVKLAPNTEAAKQLSEFADYISMNDFPRTRGQQTPEKDVIKTIVTIADAVASEKKTISPLAADKSMQDLFKEYFRIDSLTRSDIDEMNDIVEKLQSDPSALRRMEMISKEGFNLLPGIGQGEVELPEKIITPTPATSLEQAVIVGLSDYLIKRVEKEIAFIFYENLNNGLFKANSFIRDTLFYNTSQSFLNAPEGVPSVLVLKESLNRDIHEFPDNLMKYPVKERYRGLIYLKYTLSFLQELQKTERVEQAIANLEGLLVKKGDGNLHDFERGLVFISRYFQYLQQHDILEQLNGLDAERQKIIILLAIADFAKQYPEIGSVRKLEEAVSSVLAINKMTIILLNDLKKFKGQLGDYPHADYTEYQRFVADRSVYFLRNSLEIIRQGVKLCANFSDAPINRINDYINISKSICDGYFLIKDGKYIQGVTCFLPTIYELSYRPSAAIIDDHVKVLHKNIFRSSDKVALKGRAFYRDVEKVSDLLKKAPSQIKQLVDSIKTVKDGELTLPLYNKFLADTHLEYLGDYLYDLSTADRDKHVSFLLAMIAEIDDVKKSSAAAFESALRKVAALKGTTDLSALLQSREIKIALTYLHLPDLKPSIKQLLELGAEMSSARSAEDVKNILSNYTLPEASYRIKRRRPTTIMINAYVGVGAHAYSKDDIKPVLFAPIGLEYSFHVGQSGLKYRNNISIFASIIDVGNVINYRLSKDEDEPQFRFNQLISPGAFIQWSPFKKLPFSVGVGYQSYPDRLTTHISFDLPLFRLF